MNTLALKPDAETAEAAEWTLAVGAFFRNFALIELLSVEFVARMADPFKYKSMKKKFLAQRLAWIAETLHERTSDADKAAEVIEVLESIREESYFRNILAHGAAGFSKPEGDASPSLIGILNFKPEDDSQDAEMISLEEIQGRRDESAALAAKLLACLNGLEFLPLG